MNVKMLIISGSVFGLGMLGLGARTANAGGVAYSVSVGAPVVLAQPVVYQQVVQQPVVYQQVPVVCQQVVQAPCVPQTVIVPACTPVFAQPQPIYVPAPVIYRDGPRFIDRDDLRHDDRGRVEIRYGDRR